jgi:hypothetical protein
MRKEMKNRISTITILMILSIAGTTAPQTFYSGMFESWYTKSDTTFKFYGQGNTIDTTRDGELFPNYILLLNGTCPAMGSCPGDFISEGPESSLIHMHYQYLPPPFEATDAGAKIYFDRNYKITDVSVNLVGLTVLPIMNNSKTQSLDTLIWAFKTRGYETPIYIGFHSDSLIQANGLLDGWLGQQGWEKMSRRFIAWEGTYPEESGNIVKNVISNKNTIRAFNTPNPMTTHTRISYSVPAKEDDVHINVYDITGKIIKHLAPNRDAGFANWDGKDEKGIKVPAGVYLYKITNGTDRFIGKMMLAR